jgi:hypothetical protein
MNYFITIKKAVLGLLTGLAAAVVSAMVTGVMAYQPVVCSAEVTEACLPPFFANLYSNSLVPFICAGLVALANWLKNRNK